MPCSPLDDLDDEIDRRVSSDDDDDSEDDEPLLTQPPPLHNSVRNAESRVPFLDSIRRVIDNESDFNLRNDVEYTNPPAPPSIVIPDYVSSAIRNELQLTWGYAHPRSYQIEAIFHLVYQNTDMMYLIRQTGEGKSLVMQGMASMLKGVTIVMVPLLGLGSDLESKCTTTTANVEAYHLDEYRLQHASILCNHLNNYSRKEKTSIILLVSPQQFTKKSYWYTVLLSLASRGCVSAVCIDKAHSTVHNYKSFRPEFKTAIDTINSLVSVARRAAPAMIYVPILVMSATFTIADQHAFNLLIGRFPTIVFWGEMALNNGTFLSLTGDCGLMLKSFLMASFCGDTQTSTDASDDTNTQTANDTDILTSLPRIWCMPCTSASNCGISSINCTTCFRVGPPPSWHEMVQEMGRVDRLHNSAHGTNTYNIFLNVNTFISLWLHVHCESNVSVRDRQRDDLFQILRMLILPRQCYHARVEQRRCYC